MRNLKIKLIVTLLLLATFAIPAFADFEVTRQNVLSNNPNLVYLNYGTDEKLWFVDTKSIQSRKAPDGTKYWIINAYKFKDMSRFLNNVFDGNHQYYGDIKEGIDFTLTDVFKFAVNRTQPQIQVLETGNRPAAQFALETSSWPFNSDRWQEFEENTFYSEIYKYVKEHGGNDLCDFGSKGTILAVLAIIGMSIIVVVKYQKDKRTRNSNSAPITETTMVNQNTQSVKFCRKCGAKVSADAQFCGKCGEKF